MTTLNDMIATVQNALNSYSGTQEQVTYVEARHPSGEPANAQSCYDALKSR